MIALGCLLFLSLGASANPTTPDELYAAYRLKYEAWAVACAYSKYDCKDVKAPKVVYQDRTGKSLGEYAGGDEVWIADDLIGKMQVEVIAHEMVHYLQVKVGGALIPDYPSKLCPLEAEAYLVIDTWLIDIGYGTLARGPLWYHSYPACMVFTITIGLLP
jgi:hypothetical protein